MPDPGHERWRPGRRWRVGVEIVGLLATLLLAYAVMDRPGGVTLPPPFGSPLMEAVDAGVGGPPVVWIDLDDRSRTWESQNYTPNAAVAEVLDAVAAQADHTRPLAVLIDVAAGSNHDRQDVTALEAALVNIRARTGTFIAIFAGRSCLQSENFDPHGLARLGNPEPSGAMRAAEFAWFCPVFPTNQQRIWTCVAGPIDRGAPTIALPGPLLLGASLAGSAVGANLHEALASARQACMSSEHRARLLGSTVDMTAPLLGYRSIQANAVDPVSSQDLLNGRHILPAGAIIVIGSSVNDLRPDLHEVRGKSVAGPLLVAGAFRQGYGRGLPVFPGVSVLLLVAAMAYGLTVLTRGLLSATLKRSVARWAPDMIPNDWFPSIVATIVVAILGGIAVGPLAGLSATVGLVTAFAVACALACASLSALLVIVLNWGWYGLSKIVLRSRGGVGPDAGDGGNSQG
ncbi:hypothetical protein [Brevundimonas sp.]|uniref:hypothetical protein n=1 Tax=Brevundimonas sp. TaxID=1871086 RepID=UPI002AB99969|nr:hypothetical protein [Brevundimonas sp.]MDZ4364400.1 hypothetical protein [Brevundimonas sp.]